MLRRKQDLKRKDFELGLFKSKSVSDAAPSSQLCDFGELLDLSHPRFLICAVW
jgi:hypothetical protein